MAPRLAPVGMINKRAALICACPWTAAKSQTNALTSAPELL